MKAKQILLAAIVLLGGGRVGATVDLQFVSQDRSVSAEEHVSGLYDQTQRFSTPDWGPFEAAARVAWTYWWEPSSSVEPREYSAVAWQASDLTPQGITAQGSAGESGPFYCYGHPLQFAHSDFQVEFTLPTSSTWSLDADLYARGDYGGTNKGWYEASIQLSRGTGTIFSAEQIGAPPYGDPSVSWPELHLYEMLSLAAGTYILDGHASAYCFYTPDYDWPGCGGGGEARYGIELVAIPAPAVMPLTLWGLGVLALLRRRMLTGLGRRGYPSVDRR
jgi:hypothetical protein